MTRGELDVLIWVFAILAVLFFALDQSDREGQ